MSWKLGVSKIISPLLVDRQFESLASPKFPGFCYIPLLYIIILPNNNLCVSAYEIAEIKFINLCCEFLLLANCGNAYYLVSYLAISN